jgi:hypothetical protein
MLVDVVVDLGSFGSYNKEAQDDYLYSFGRTSRRSFRKSNRNTLCSALRIKKKHVGGPELESSLGMNHD